MDVRFINPFLDGAQEVLKTMAFTDASPGKIYLKKGDMAHGDISGIIGITGDAIGSLAVSFHTNCICGIVSSMLGESYTEPTREVLDAVGELTTKKKNEIMAYVTLEDLNGSISAIFFPKPTKRPMIFSTGTSLCLSEVPWMWGKKV